MVDAAVRFDPCVGFVILGGMDERPRYVHVRLPDPLRVYGPVSLKTLQQWAQEGRVGPGCEVSPDGREWMAADRIAELGLEWWIKLPNGEWFGPIHLSAAAALAAEYGLPDDLPVRRGLSGSEMRLSAALAQSRSAPRSAPIIDEERVLKDLRRALGIR